LQGLFLEDKDLGALPSTCRRTGKPRWVRACLSADRYPDPLFL